MTCASSTRSSPARGAKCQTDRAIASSTSTATTLSDLLQALDAPRRSALRQMLRGLGGGLAGRGARLNEGLRDIARGLRNFSLTVEPVVRARTLPRLVRAA